MAKMDYLQVLKALKEIPFGVGKKLLIEFLQGKNTNESIVRNNLNKCESFGSLAYTDDELTALINNLISNNLISLTSIKGNQFWKVLELNDKGKKEIETPELYTKKLAFGFKETETTITDQERALFKVLPFIQKYNDEQKKAIICNNPKILCIAGAGSGKTTVLTKRIEFLIRYRSVDPRKILAITFTKKARQEMQSRISDHFTSIETFNSFCERILKTHNNLIYDRPVKVISYRDKIILIKKALSSINLSMNKAIDIYFSWAQKRGKSEEKLANILLNDIFFLRDYFKFKNMQIDNKSFKIDQEHERSFNMILDVCKYIDKQMEKYGYRDFADQLIDTLALFKSHPELIPQYDHILIDEFQDVNSTQIELIDLIFSENLFCVGDPRQSIFGWRGSDIKYILNFEDKYPKCEIINLKKNYRSTESIVKLINSSIKSMGLTDLESNIAGDKNIKLHKFPSQSNEFDFVARKILESKRPRNEIFVLARTNKQLHDLSQVMKQKKIKHVVRSDEVRRSVVAKNDEITLATVHAIKGMEAELVFVIGCTPNNFPCKGSEHPVIDVAIQEDYDKEEEEIRLFYVAMSRARKKLCLTYTGSMTYFITDDMMKFMDLKTIQSKLTSTTKASNSKDNPTKANYKNTAAIKSNRSNNILSRLREWRNELSQQTSHPAYFIMHDSTLMDIATVMPQTLSELQDIKGLGPTKIMKYGEQILDIIQGK